MSREGRSTQWFGPRSGGEGRKMFAPQQGRGMRAERREQREERREKSEERSEKRETNMIQRRRTARREKSPE